jgi:hypothetical protein
MEPWAVSRRRALGELRAAGVTWMIWARAAVVSAIVVLLLIAAMLIWAPGVVIPWPRVIIGLILWPIVICASSYVQMLAPVFITVDERYVQFTSGQSRDVIKSKDVRSVRLDGGTEPPRLLIEYTSRSGNQRARWFALSPKMDRAQLEDVMERLLAQASDRDCST